MPQDVRNEIVFVAEARIHFRCVPDSTVFLLVDSRKWTRGPVRDALQCVFCSHGKRDCAAAARFRHPECRPALVNIVPFEGDGLAQASTGIHQKYREVQIEFRSAGDFAEQHLFFVGLQEAQAPRFLLLAFEFRQIVDVPILYAFRSNFPSAAIFLLMVALLLPRLRSAPMRPSSNSCEKAEKRAPSKISSSSPMKAFTLYLCLPSSHRMSA